MSNPITTESLKAWLRETNRDRAWLAETLGFSKRTVDNWFTDGSLPLPAIKHLERIFSEEARPDKLKFSLEEWDQIENARRMAGFTDRAEFITKALTSYAHSLTPQPTSYRRTTPRPPLTLNEDP